MAFKKVLSAAIVIMNKINKSHLIKATSTEIQRDRQQKTISLKLPRKFTVQQSSFKKFGYFRQCDFKGLCQEEHSEFYFLV